MPGINARKPTGIVPWPLILVEGGEKAGKAQPLDAAIATPTGWTTMGALVVGDRVLGSDGRPTTVTAVHERGARPIYRLTFSDGAVTEACDEHLWATWTSSSLHSTYNKGPKKGQRNHRPAVVRTTEEIRDLVLSGIVLHVPMTAPVEYDASSAPLPLDPYALGLLLGDGGLTKPSYPVFTTADPELADALGSLLPGDDCLTRNISGPYSHGVKGGATTAALRSLGLIQVGSADKFVPKSFLRGTTDQRLALLQGLMDTDGGMEGKSITFTSVSPALAEHVRELVRSLGGSASMLTKETGYRNALGERVICKPAHRVTMRLPKDVCPFRLGRKVARWESCRPTFDTPPRRTIRAVDYVGEREARCITVAAADHLYLTDHFIVTHNSFSAAQFSSSEKVGQTYWIDLGEGSADEYGAIAGARYLVVEHDGSWKSLLEQVDAVRAEAKRASDAGEPPVVLVIDSMTAEWDLLKDFADDRARGRLRAKGKKVGEEVTISMDLWNEATARHRRLMTLLLTFPGIVVMIARGKEVASLDANGRPVEGSKTYKVEGHKNLAFDASVWVRMSREAPPTVVGARSVHAGIRPGVDKPQQAPKFTLEWLVFEVLKCDPGTAKVRDLTEPKPHEDNPPEDEPAQPTPPQSKISRGPVRGEKKDVSKPVSGILASKNVDVVTWWAGKAKQNGDDLADATPYLTQDDRDALGLEDGVSLTVDEVVKKVTAYVTKHGSGPRHVPDEQATG